LPKDKSVVNSSRNEQLIKPLCDPDATETGVQIKFITDQEGPFLVMLKAGGIEYVRGPAVHGGS
jgi:iron(III) transport system substrate-binding protein